MKVPFYILLVIFCTNVSAQSNIVEYKVKNGYGGDNGREFLIFNPIDSYYFDFVDGSHQTYDEILRNYNIARGGQKSYRKLDQINLLVRINITPNSGRKHYLIIDDKPSIKWSIKVEKKMILGYECTKAEGNFRGRDYIVWFTENIPVKIGPWKLDGLPGLILEAQDTKGTFKYEAITYIKNSGFQVPDIVYEFMEKFDKSKIKNYKDLINEEDAWLKDIQQKSIANLPKGTNISEIPSVRDLRRETNFEWENTNMKK